MKKGYLKKEILLKEYLKERKAAAGCLCMLLVIVLAVSVLNRIPTDIYVYMVELWLFFLLLTGLVDWAIYRKKYRMVEDALAMEELDEIRLPETGAPLEMQYQQLIRRLQDEKRLTDERYVSSISEMRDYYATWAHQIKTPIAAVDVLLQAVKEEEKGIQGQNAAVIREEMFKISFYTDAVMNYLRLEDTSSDFVFAECRIRDVVNAAVKKFRTQFIGHRLSLQIDCGDETLKTDEKWLGFILEQLLSNSVKYTPAGRKIRVYCEHTEEQGEIRIVVEDNGIGIREEDLPRIMERGFTGYNGRMDKNSTGIGLYLCRKAACRLGGEIKVYSELGRGTRACICFIQKHQKHE